MKQAVGEIRRSLRVEKVAKATFLSFVLTH